MNESMLEYVIMGLIVILPFVFMLGNLKSKKSIKLTDFQPIIVEMLLEMQDLIKAKEKSYDELEALAVDLMIKRIEDTKVLSHEEAALLNKEVIRALLRPHLQRLYEQKPHKN